MALVKRKRLPRYRRSSLRPAILRKKRKFRSYRPVRKGRPRMNPQPAFSRGRASRLSRALRRRQFGLKARTRILFGARRAIRFRKPRMRRYSDGRRSKVE